MRAQYYTSRSVDIMLWLTIKMDKKWLLDITFYSFYIFWICHNGIYRQESRFWWTDKWKQIKTCLWSVHVDLNQTSINWRYFATGHTQQSVAIGHSIDGDHHQRVGEQWNRQVILSRQLITLGGWIKTIMSVHGVSDGHSVATTRLAD